MGNEVDKNAAVVRTHEPRLQELTAQFDARKEFDTERDRRYEERFKAMDEKTGLALTASKEAVLKAEGATEKRFDSVNEFRKTLSDQASTFYPRGEALTKFEAYDEKLDDMKKELAGLREYRVEGQTKNTAAKDSRLELHWMIALVVTVLGFVVGHFWR